MEEKNKKNDKKSLKRFIIDKVITAILVVVIMLCMSLGNIGDIIPTSTNVKNGLSAYEIAVEYGFDGTIEDWLKSLNGKSAYEIAVENGYSGSESDWVDLIENNNN